MWPRGSAGTSSAGLAAPTPTVRASRPDAPWVRCGNGPIGPGTGQPAPASASLDSPRTRLYKPALRTPARNGGRGAQVAQLVEHVTENHGVGGSIPPLGTNKINNLG